jgi:hypothetical protein
MPLPWLIAFQGQILHTTVNNLRETGDTTVNGMYFQSKLHDAHTPRKLEQQQQRWRQ